MSMSNPAGRLVSLFWTRVERAPQWTVAASLIIFLLIVGVMTWRGLVGLEEKELNERQTDLRLTSLGVAAIVHNEARRLDVLRKYAESLMAIQAGPTAVPADSALTRVYASRNEPIWNLPLTQGGVSAIGFGPSQLAGFDGYQRRDDLLLTDLYVARSVGRLLDVMVRTEDLEESGRIISRNGFYVGVPEDTIDPQRWLERFIAMPYYRDAMPDRDPGRLEVRTGIYTGLVHMRLVFSLSAPVYHDDQFRGVVVLDVNQEVFARFLGAATSGALKRVLTSRSGDVYAVRGEPMAVGQKLPEDLGTAWKSVDPAALWTQQQGQIRGQDTVLLFQRVGDTDMMLVDELSIADIQNEAFRHIRPNVAVILVALALMMWLTLSIVALLIGRLRERSEAFRQMAEQDPLTGLANRRVFESRYLLERQGMRRRPAPLALLMIDVDHFKRVNDTWGHGNGDRVLVAVARTCRDTLREVDLPARVGGEEFAVLLPNSSLSQAAEVAERLRNAFSQVRVQAMADKEWANDPANSEIRFTVSIGVAEITEDGVDSLDAFLAAADRRLYRAKALGRDRVVAFDTDDVLE
jgi:diguanylate cyclase (GGDEF)-like protein